MRRTSSYMLETFPEGDLELELDDLVMSYRDDVEASGFSRSKRSAFIRFRLSSDEDAKAVATELRPTGEYILSVGYGIGWTLIHDTRSWSEQKSSKADDGVVR